MPTYVFKCKTETCRHTQTKNQKYTDPPPVCEKCKGDMDRAIAQSSFVLKGSGWFNTGGY
jgi:putative FmdB family regulatory protein